jgi:hypothetical protein
MFLLGLLRVAGVEPAGTGLRIAPTGAVPELTVELPLLRLALRPGVLVGEYRAQNAGALTLQLAPPPRGTLEHAELDGQPVPIADNAAELRLRFRPGERRGFAIRWRD